MIDRNRRTLDERTVHPDPIIQFQRWLDEANRSEINMPNAMALATVSPSGQPSMRMVLLKDADSNGFVFYTNYDSRKGKELLANQRVELMFWWTVLERQVRIEGIAEKVAPEESDEYFRTRPRESQIGAHASQQSEIIANRDELEKKADEITRRFHGKEIPRPAQW
jgi:pyridoxamine 5'-phosphate oxidase